MSTKKVTRNLKNFTISNSIRPSTDVKRDMLLAVLAEQGVDEDICPILTTRLLPYVSRYADRLVSYMEVKKALDDLANSVLNNEEINIEMIFDLYNYEFMEPPFHSDIDTHYSIALTSLKDLFDMLRVMSPEEQERVDYLKSLVEASSNE